jgi:hypothetical protein
MRTYFLAFICLYSTVVLSQEEKKNIWKNMTLNGYVSNMQIITYSNILEEQLKATAVALTVDSLQSVLENELEGVNFPWLKDNQMHNRLNYKWYLNDNFTFTAHLRTRFNWGDQVLIESVTGNPDKFNIDYRNLSLSQTDQLNYTLKSQFDRLWLQYTNNNLEITLGRQRINWAQTFAFNPNDIFNTYSFFEYDYPEKPGSDALRISYYTGMASLAEAAISVDTANKVTVGGLYRFNKWNYDIQVLGGFMNEQDYVVGAGWSGYIKNTSFRGEASYFHPKQNFSDTTGVWVVSAGGDYSFPNSLFIQAEFLFNQFPGGNEPESIFSLFSEQLSSKQLSIAKFTYLLSASYTINPRLNAALSGLYYPKKDGFYVGPSFDYSLGNSADVSLIGQVFSLKEDEIRYNTFLAVLRLKYNF